jgi:hypothetical protein
MDLLEKYLQAVRTLLPRKQQDDIVRELSENLRSQIDDKEEEFGRPLAEGELAEIIRRHGHPLVVAGRYRSNQYLISPGLFPFYLFALRAGLGVALGVTVLLTAVALGLAGGGTGQIVNGLLAFPGRAVTVFAWITIGFAAFDFAQSRMKLTHNWDPRNLPKLVKPTDRVSRWSAFCEAIGTAALVVWLLLLPKYPFLWFGPLQSVLTPAPIWSEVYVPLLLLWLGTFALSTANVVRPYRTTARSLARVAIHFSSFLIFVLLARADVWVTVASGASLGDTEGLGRLVRVINAGASVGLWIAAGLGLIEMARELRRWLTWRRLTLRQA